MSYTAVGGAAANFVATGTTGPTSLNQLSCHTPVYYNGTAWITKMPRTGADSTTSVAPSASKDAVIYTGTVAAGALNCRSYNLVTGATHNLGANTLNVGGNMVNNGTLSASTGTLNLVGTTALQTADQTVSGSGSLA